MTKGGGLDMMGNRNFYLKDGEEIIKSRIDQANGRAANCTKNEDALFVIEKYKESKQAFAILKKGKEGAVEEFSNIIKKLTDIEKINKKAIDSLNYYIKELSPKLSKGNSKIDKLLEEVDENLDSLESGFSKPNILNTKLDALELKIEDIKQDYIKDFPKSEVRFNKLISKTRGIHIKYFVLNHVELSDLREKHRKYENATRGYLSRSNFLRKRKFKTKSPVRCISTDEAQKKMNEIELIYIRSALAIKDNEHLSAGCTPIVTEASQDDFTQDDSTQNPNITDNNPPPRTSIDSTSTNTPTPEKSVFGGLTIGGPSQLTVGKGAQFIALDRAGDPYPNQDGTWVNTRQDLMVLSSTGSGTTFRAGNATIMLKFEGMTAWKDVEIKAKNGDDSMGDIEEGDSYEENSLEEKCYNLIDRITISLNSGNIERARIETNKALAFGCDVNAGAVNAVIAQIEDEKEKKQKEWELEYAQQENERRLEADRIKAERRKQRNENLNAFVGLLGEKLNEINNSNNPPTSTTDKSDEKHIKDIEVKKQNVTITIWDYGCEDGDKITLKINGKAYLSNYTITNAKKTIQVPLFWGNNTIEIIADDSGTDCPPGARDKSETINSAAISVSDAISGGNQSWSLKQGSSSKANVIVKL